MAGLSLSGDDESLLYSWFAEDYETSGFLCQAVERQKAEEILMVSALGLKRVHPDVVHVTVGLTGAVLVAFAAKLAFSRQMSACGHSLPFRISALASATGG
jgi:hypothetical protein